MGSGTLGKGVSAGEFQEFLLDRNCLRGPNSSSTESGFAFLSCSECSECADLFGSDALFLEAGTLSRKLIWKLLKC